MVLLKVIWWALIFVTLVTERFAYHNISGVYHVNLNAKLSFHGFETSEHLAFCLNFRIIDPKICPKETIDPLLGDLHPPLRYVS